MNSKREPIGTTRGGQVILGGVGLIFGLGFCAGLILLPSVFEPLLQGLIVGADTYLHAHIRYDPSQRGFYAMLLGFIGLLWLALTVRAFIRHPEQDKAIDTYLNRQNELDRARVASINAQDDPKL